MLNKGHSQESLNCANYSRSIPLNLLFGTPVGGTTSNSVPEKCPIGHFTVVYVVAKPLIEAEGDLGVIETSI